MSETILNLLPLHEGEREEFEAIAPDAAHVYARSSTVTPEQLAAATVIFGWPRAESMKQAVSLKWFQTMWAGTEEYADFLPEGILFTSSSGSNSRSVAEHMLTGLMAVCRRLPAYLDSQRAHVWKDEGPMKTVLGGTVLVLGAGNVGSTFAGLCQGLGAKTIGLKRSVTGPVAGFDEVRPMDELDALADEYGPHRPDEGRRHPHQRRAGICAGPGRPSAGHDGRQAVGRGPGRHRSGASAGQQPPVGCTQPAPHPPRGRGPAAGDHPPEVCGDGPGEPAPVFGRGASEKPCQIMRKSCRANGRTYTWSGI